MIPSFGILMINYNHGPYLAQAIESVLAQTFGAWELAIVDDGSTDGSIEVAARFQDSRIQIIQRPENGGMSAASRAGMELLTAPVVGILDSDDVLEPHAVETMASAWERAPDAAMLYSMHWRCDLALAPVPDVWQSAALPEGWTALDAYRRGGIELGDGSLGTVGPFRTFSRAAYDLTAGFDRRWVNSQDFDLTLKLEEIGPLVFIPERLYHYRFNATRHATYPNQMHEIAKVAMFRRRLTGY